MAWCSGEESSVRIESNSFMPESLAHKNETTSSAPFGSHTFSPAEARSQ